jgi:hypothetical protein
VGAKQGNVLEPIIPLIEKKSQEPIIKKKKKKGYSLRRSALTGHKIFDFRKTSRFSIIVIAQTSRFSRRLPFPSL